MNVSIGIAVARYFYFMMVSKILLLGNMETFEYYKNVNHISVLTLEYEHFYRLCLKLVLNLIKVSMAQLFGHLKILFNIYLY